MLGGVNRLVRPEDTLIAYGWENLSLVFSFLLFMGLVLTIGILSRELENAITFTLVFTAPVFFVYMLAYTQKILGR
jgi:hypothetical protein